VLQPVGRCLAVLQNRRPLRRRNNTNTLHFNKTDAKALSCLGQLGHSRVDWRDMPNVFHRLRGFR
jgi:hypothetical protein